MPSVSSVMAGMKRPEGLAAGRERPVALVTQRNLLPEGTLPARAAVLAAAAGLVAGRPRWRAVCATAVFLAAGGMTLGARLEESSRAAATRRGGR